ncbi:hypothetical protein [Telmatospirillum siberiense]|uniref:Glycosyltransferase RgtA/B/C/D-like domain-containing protein n=1 Tax=Telmatospirillum siberiense TaxID=382514 RepID=A0A2N3PXV2_9PROT|nr:hypothetical protein [Telmatospirillum siberiense]PKU25227.1 hypothetical protein CWS72_06345 [Telmatospirillum siberiense]
MSEHLIVAAATYLVAILVMSLGALIGVRRPAMALVVGWGIATLTLVLLGTVGGMALSPVLAALAVLGLCGLFRWRRLEWRAAFPVLVLGLPYLAIAASITPAGYDEYSQWLPNILYLVRYDHFPSLGGDPSISIHPGYPHASAFVGLAVSRLTGILAETAVINWNALLNLAVGGLASEMILARSVTSNRWCSAAIGLLANGILSPAFVPAMYLSNYGDAITGQVAAIMVGEILLGGIAFARRSDGLAIGLAAASLVSIRQDSFSIFGIMLIAWLLLLFWRARGRPSPASLLGPLLSLPFPLITWWLWQHYQIEQIPEGVASVQPWAAWYWGDLPAILGSILAVLGHKCGYTLALAATIVGGGFFYRKLAPAVRESALFGAAMGLGHLVSMVGIYLAVDTGGEAARVAPEFWRFTQHVAPVVIFCALPLLPLRSVFKDRYALYLPVAVILIECAAFPFLRVDAPRPKHTVYVDLRQMAQEMANSLPPHAHVAMVEMDTDAGTIQEIFPLHYRYLALRAETPADSIYMVAGTPPRSVTLAASPPKSKEFRAFPPEVDYAWVSDGGPEPSLIMGTDLAIGSSYLLRRDGDHFVIQSSWPRRI